jgi:hypothetical protein
MMMGYYSVVVDPKDAPVNAPRPGRSGAPVATVQ